MLSRISQYYHVNFPPFILIFRKKKGDVTRQNLLSDFL